MTKELEQLNDLVIELVTTNKILKEQNSKLLELINNTLTNGRSNK